MATVDGQAVSTTSDTVKCVYLHLRIAPESCMDTDA